MATIGASSRPPAGSTHSASNKCAVVLRWTDSDGLPVTVEQIYLPYSSDGAKPDCMISMLQACSTEGRFSIRGLLRPGESKAPHHFAVIIDPSLAPPKPTAPAADAAAIELEV